MKQNIVFGKGMRLLNLLLFPVRSSEIFVDIGSIIDKMMQRIFTKPIFPHVLCNHIADHFWLNDL